MENQQPQQPQVQPQTPMTNEQMLAEILEQSRKTKNYMKWQLIITVALVVLPLIATLAIIPFVLSSLGSVYSSAGLDTSSAAQLQELLK
jgi:predicted anti-sigma-YlaC factor YlaD